MAGKIPVAFLAGFISVLTPCVLPLLPGYLSAVSAVEAGRLGERGMARRVAISSVPFIAGFSVVFVLIGAGAAAVGGLVDADAAEAIAGFVARRARPRVHGAAADADADGRAGAARGSAAHRLGESCSAARSPLCAAPCIGTVLASVVVLAGDADSVVPRRRGAVRVLAGPGLAFLAAGIAFTRAMGAFRWLRDHYRVIQFVSGAILVALGLLLFFNRDWWLRVAVERAAGNPGVQRGRGSRRRRARARRPSPVEQAATRPRDARGVYGVEAALGFLELALAADLVAAAGLVPGDDHVHEALEEVALLGLGRAPGELDSSCASK